jgi:hypothetical protein
MGVFLPPPAVCHLSLCKRAGEAGGCAVPVCGVGCSVSGRRWDRWVGATCLCAWCSRHRMALLNKFVAIYIISLTVRFADVPPKPTKLQETGGQGITLATLRQPVTVEYPFSALTVYRMLAFDVLLYCLLLWYLDQVSSRAVPSGLPCVHGRAVDACLCRYICLTPASLCLHPLGRERTMGNYSPLPAPALYGRSCPQT